MLGQKALVKVQEVDRALCFRKSRDPAWEALSVLGGTRDVEARGAEAPDSGPGACSPRNTKSAGERHPRKGTEQVYNELCLPWRSEESCIANLSVILDLICLRGGTKTTFRVSSSGI